MAHSKRSVEFKAPRPERPAEDEGLLVEPDVPDLIPDVDGAMPNTISFRATYLPLRVEFHPWAPSEPSEEDNEFLDLYWNGELVERKTFNQPVKPEELFILVPVRYLIEGTHTLHYEVTIFNGTEVPSRPLNVYIDKTPPMLDPDDDRLGFPDYVIGEGVTEEYLDANGDKVVGTVPSFLGAEPGDVIKWFWSDDPVGIHLVDMHTLTLDDIELSGGISKPIELTFPGDFIRQSQGGQRFARYEVQDRAGTAVQRSLARTLNSDPSPPPRVLPPPFIREATGSEYFSTLLPADAVDGVTFVIPDGADIRPNETVTVYWGEPGTLGGYSTSTPIAPGGREYLIPGQHIPPHMENRAELHYQIDKPDMPPSPSHFVTVRKIEGLPIVQCTDIVNGALELNRMGDSAAFTLADWAFRAPSQFVNAWIEGVERDNIGSLITLPIATELPVPSGSGEMVLGEVARTELSRLALNYQFRVSVQVSFDDKQTWLKFPDVAAVLQA
ncbi:hypothetical protein ACTORR_06465 [Pseudomonas sp. SAR267]|jgi:hypothetical protein|uniref:hypothetical protein n=2 Tax=Pseudomonas TaxID=286 RepID=UPI002113D4CA|nr:MULTISPECIES: hypothetical protein [unclassified Pseudomonas]